MRLSSGHLRSSFPWAIMLGVAVLSGCGHWCYAGYPPPGSNGSPTQPTGGTTCASSNANGMVAVALKSPICKGCTPSGEVEHIFVTLQGIQLHANAMNEPADADWIELSTELANLPRQIDLLGDSPPEALAENAHVPAGYYREIRLQFFEQSSVSTDDLPAENACGKTGWNCVVHADGTIEALGWPQEVPELVIPLEGVHSNSMAVLPNVETNLNLRLELRPEFLFSNTGGWRVQKILVGQVETTQPQSLGVENSAPNIQ